MIRRLNVERWGGEENKNDTLHCDYISTYFLYWTRISGYSVELGLSKQ